jgi:hypothetical protein
MPLKAGCARQQRRIDRTVATDAVSASSLLVARSNRQARVTGMDVMRRPEGSASERFHDRGHLRPNGSDGDGPVGSLRAVLEKVVMNRRLGLM